MLTRNTQAVKIVDMETKYRVTTDGETPCLSGHGIIEVEPIDGVTAIVTVEGNGVMFEQHAATCAAILEWEEVA